MMHKHFRISDLSPFFISKRDFGLVCKRQSVNCLHITSFNPRHSPATHNLRAPLFTKDSRHSFANVVAGWTVENGLIETNQSPLGNLKKSDLQIAAVTATGSATKAFSMDHQMGLAKVTLGSKSVPTTQYYTVSGTNTETKGTTEGTTTVTASSTFTGNTMFVSGTTCYAVLPKSTNRAFKGTGLDVWIETYTANAAAGECCTYTAASKRTFIKKGWIYEYADNNMYSLAITQAGSYKLEVWGASGGSVGHSATSAYITTGGLGGYSYGVSNLTQGTNLYICVGGKGSDNRNPPTSTETSARLIAGGYNGGGTAYQKYDAHEFVVSGGGGATHIAKNNNRGVLANYKNYSSEILIVAGGGGGSTDNLLDTDEPTTWEGIATGGSGGGNSGGRPQSVPNQKQIFEMSDHTLSVIGGTQNSPGENVNYSVSTTSFDANFGKGWCATTNSQNSLGTKQLAGGGGGWYGGATSWGYGAGGGSGYIGGVSGGSTSNGVRGGNGYARITTNFEWTFE